MGLNDIYQTWLSQHNSRVNIIMNVDLPFWSYNNFEMFKISKN